MLSLSRPDMEKKGQCFLLSTTLIFISHFRRVTEKVLIPHRIGQTKHKIDSVTGPILKMLVSVCKMMSNI